MTCQKDWDHVVRKTSSSWWQKWKHCDWRKPTKPARKRENPGDTAGALDPALPENYAEISVIWVHTFSLPTPFWVWISAVCISKKLHLYSRYTYTLLLDPHYSGFPGEIFRLETLKLLRLHILPAYWFQENHRWDTGTGLRQMFLGQQSLSKVWWFLLTIHKIKTMGLRWHCSAPMRGAY